MTLESPRIPITVTVDDLQPIDRNQYDLDRVDEAAQTFMRAQTLRDSLALDLDPEKVALAEELAVKIEAVRPTFDAVRHDIKLRTEKGDAPNGFLSTRIDYGLRKLHNFDSYVADLRQSLGKY